MRKLRRSSTEEYSRAADQNQPCLEERPYTIPFFSATPSATEGVVAEQPGQPHVQNPQAVWFAYSTLGRVNGPEQVPLQPRAPTIDEFVNQNLAAVADQLTPSKRGSSCQRHSDYIGHWSQSTQRGQTSAKTKKCPVDAKALALLKPRRKSTPWSWWKPAWLAHLIFSVFTPWTAQLESWTFQWNRLSRDLCLPH